MRLLPMGDRAILVELPDARTRRDWDDALRAARAQGFGDGQIIEHVPAAQTVLVRVRDRDALAPIATALRAFDPAEHGGAARAVEDALVIPVHYDGEDLDTIAEVLNLSREGFIDWHTGRAWRVDFAGFSPGFGYLVRELADGEQPMQMPRRESPRVRVPAGSVALAGPWTGIYPTATSGGWQLAGHTDLPMWDDDREPPALLTPGRQIRFEVA